MLEHYSHIRIDAFDNARRGAEKNGDGNGNEKHKTNGDGPEAPNNGGEIPLLLTLAEGLTSQFAFERIAALR
jgi:hypothetical protein